MKIKLTRGEGCGPNGKDPYRKLGVKVSHGDRSLEVYAYTTDVLRHTLNCFKVWRSPLVRDCGSYKRPMSKERVRCEDCEGSECYGWRLGPVRLIVTRPCTCERCVELRRGEGAAESSRLLSMVKAGRTSFAMERIPGGRGWGLA